MRVTMDLRQLITELRAAQARMSRKNEHRALLAKCELALMALWRERADDARVPAGGIMGSDFVRQHPVNGDRL